VNELSLRAAIAALSETPFPGFGHAEAIARTANLLSFPTGKQQADLVLPPCSFPFTAASYG